MFGVCCLVCGLWLCLVLYTLVNSVDLYSSLVVYVMY